MSVGGAAPEMQQLIVRHYSVDPESLGQGLVQLRESFLVQTSVSGNLFWAFKHPTISDAISAILGRTEGLGELYLRGTKSETIISEAVCIGAAPVQDAVVLPEALDNLLVERLAELPDEPGLNRRLFSFLDVRASEGVFKKFIALHGDFLARYAYASSDLWHDPTVCVRARAHGMALLEPELRDETSLELMRALLDRADVSFIDDDSILALIPPTKLLHLSASIRNQTLTQIPAMTQVIADEADLESDPEDNFEEIRSKLSTLVTFFEDDDTAADLIGDATSALEEAIESVADKKRRKEQEKADEEEADWNWRRLTPGRSPSVSKARLPDFRDGRGNLHSAISGFSA